MVRVSCGVSLVRWPGGYLDITTNYITGLDANLIRREIGQTISPNENWLQDAAPLFNIILLYKQIRFCAVENLPGQPVRLGGKYAGFVI